MTDYVVIDHHLDEDAKVYRIVVGVPEELHYPVHDADGNPLIGDDGLPVVDTEVVYPQQEEFLFDAEDERWQNKSPDDIATRQRGIITAQLQKRVRDVERTERERQDHKKVMPGLGETL